MSMTNKELSEAIDAADKRVRECGTGQPRYEPLLAHLKALLAEQRRRAEANAMQAERAAPDGWKLVPVEPTQAMLDAGHTVSLNTPGWDVLKYRAMLAASPAQPAAAVPAQVVLTDDQIDADWAEAYQKHDLTRDIVRAFARIVASRVALTPQPAAAPESAERRGGPNNQAERPTRAATKGDHDH